MSVSVFSSTWANTYIDIIDETAKYETSGVSKNALSFATEAGALMGSPEQEEDRENLATFETWGTPAARGKPGKISLCLFSETTIYRSRS